ncbi:MAG: methyltransferase domain-containing protein [Gemmatimonadaceae bacterium]|nr:methyltransferase domain-containing protein [Gemmatimonadaceae bacterium]
MPASDWWATYFDADYVREFEPLFAEERNRMEVARLLEVLALPDGARVLDCPCGQGRHAQLLAEAGLDVTGLDYSAPLLAMARTRGTGRTLRYVQGDMRTLPAEWTGRFDAVLNLFTSFGFFEDEQDDARTLREFARVLAPGGTLAWFGGARDGVMAKWVASDRWTTRDGTTVAHARSFDPLDGRITIRTTWHGRHGSGDRVHRIRLYTADRLAQLCTEAGLVVTAVHDGWDERPVKRTSPEMLLVARRP